MSTRIDRTSRKESSTHIIYIVLDSSAPWSLYGEPSELTQRTQRVYTATATIRPSLSRVQSTARAPNMPVYGYTSAVGAIGQAMGITVRTARHAHALMSLNLQQKQQQPSSSSSSNADGTSNAIANRKEHRGTVLFSARLVHLPEITTLLSRYVIFPRSFSRKNGPRGQWGPARGSHGPPLPLLVPRGDVSVSKVLTDRWNC